MNVTGKKSKHEKKWGKYQKQFAFVARNYVRFRSSRIHNNMNVKNAIEKLHKITTKKEM